jgi:hypothetical protein
MIWQTTAIRIDFGMRGFGIEVLGIIVAPAWIAPNGALFYIMPGGGRPVCVGRHS